MSGLSCLCVPRVVAVSAVSGLLVLGAILGLSLSQKAAPAAHLGATQLSSCDCDSGCKASKLLVVPSGVTPREEVAVKGCGCGSGCGMDPKTAALSKAKAGCDCSSGCDMDSKTSALAKKSSGCGCGSGCGMEAKASALAAQAKGGCGCGSAEKAATKMEAPTELPTALKAKHPAPVEDKDATPAASPEPAGGGQPGGFDW